MTSDVLHEIGLLKNSIKEGRGKVSKDLKEAPYALSI